MGKAPLSNSYSYEEPESPAVISHTVNEPTHFSMEMTLKYKIHQKPPAGFFLGGEMNKT